MKTTFKSKLLLGAAVTALSFGVASGAQAADLTLTGDSVWGTTAPVNAPTAGDNVNLDGSNLTINNTSSVNVGAITDTNGTPDGNIVIVTSAASDLTQTIGSIDNGTGNFTINNSTNDGDLTVSVTGAFDIGGNVVVNGDADGTDQSADDLVLTIGGNATVAGTTAIDAGDVATATTIVNLDGASNTFTGAVTVTGGDTDAANDASLIISGAATTFTGGLTLTADVGQALLTFDGSTAQTVTGNIAGDGDITVANASGVTFNGTVTSGTILIEQAAANAAATFTNTVNSDITLGGAGTGTNTVTFNTTTQAFTVTGTVDGALDAETNNVVISGDDILTQASAWGGVAGEIDLITVSGTATLDSNSTIIADAITIGSGAKLDQGAGLITSAIANSGTIQFTGIGGITGNVTGTGTLDVDANTTITGNVAGTSADVATGITLTLAGANTYSVSNTTLTGTGAFATSAANQSISGNILAAADGNGTVTIANGAVTTTITGNIGTSSVRVGALTFGGGGNNTVTTTGNLYVDTITLDDADVLQFLGTNQVVAGDTGIVAATAGDGVITVGNGTAATNVTFNSIIGTGAGADILTINVAAASSATYNANATIDGTYTNTGTSTVGVGSIVEANDFTDTGSYVIQANDANGTLAATDFGSLTSTGGGDTLTAANLSIDVTGAMTAGTVQLLTGITTGAATLSDNSYLYSFAVADNAGNTDVTVTKATLASVATASNLSGAAGALDTLSASTNTEIAQINDKLAAASTQAAVEEIIESTTSTVDGGNVVAATTVNTQSANVIGTRLASLSNGETGMTAGNISQGLKIWAQGFGTTGSQDDRDGIDGYDVDSYGLAVGIDTETLADNWIWGLAFSYANTDVDSNNANTTETQIDTYQITLYANYDWDDATYISGQLGYAFGDNDTTRHNVGSVSGLTADGNFDSETWSARLEAGRDYEVAGNTTLTPKVLANYLHYSADSYTETGAGGANLSVDQDSMNILEFGVGVDASWTYQQADGSYLKPSVSVGVRHDVIGDEVEASNTFAAGGAAFNTKGADPADTTFNAGAGVTYFSTSNWELSAEYDFEYKEDYDAHSGLVRAAYKF